jgi:hypothetical protein
MLKTNKIFGALVISLFIFAAASVPTLARTSINISGNGSDSDNDIRVRSDYRLNFSQSNNADFDNDVRIFSNTGGNEANRNNRGDVSIDTGDSNSHVGIFNHANMNYLYYGGYNDDSDNYHYDSDNYRGGYDDHDYDSKHDNHDYNKHNDDKNYHPDWENHDNSEWKKLHTSLNGHEEVPKMGDPDGWGHAKVAVVPSMSKFCIAMQVGNIDPATAAHVHEAPRGHAGPVVIPLPTPDHNGYVKGCVDADKSQLEEIRDNPSNFYINVHNHPFPEGAIRGQLSH